MLPEGMLNDHVMEVPSRPQFGYWQRPEQIGEPIHTNVKQKPQPPRPHQHPQFGRPEHFEVKKPNQFIQHRVKDHLTDLENKENKVTGLDEYNRVVIRQDKIPVFRDKSQFTKELPRPITRDQYYHFLDNDEDPLFFDTEDEDVRVKEVPTRFSKQIKFDKVDTKFVKKLFQDLMKKYDDDDAQFRPSLL